jgi:hypothetical protein
VSTSFHDGTVISLPDLVALKSRHVAARLWLLLP